MSAVSGKDLVASVEGELEPYQVGLQFWFILKKDASLVVPTWAAGLLSKVHSIVYHLSVLGLFPGSTDRAYEITSSS